MVTSKCRAVLVLHTIVLLAASSTSYLLADNCPTPCACSGSYVYCSYKSLNSLPLNISIWNSVTYLDISNNNFSTIPMAIGQMTSLETLQIYNNPILSLNKTIMQAIGDTLTYLGISLSSFNTWPTELRYLRFLGTLALYAIPFSHLPADAFHGLESLTQLLIADSKLIKTPSEFICYLPNLQIFQFNNNRYLYDNGSITFERCGEQSITNVYLNGETLRVFPNVINMFHSLRTLQLDNNLIEHIDDELIPSECGLSYLSMANNVFTRIPFAVSKCNQLTSLDLSNNNIKYLEEPDLMGLHNLQVFSLNRNPILYVSPHAFRYNPNLSQLNLQYTQLASVPQAVTSLSHLSVLYINYGKPIDCSCDMSYLKHWLSKSVTIYGECDSSSKNITTFIKTTLQTCP